MSSAQIHSGGPGDSSEALAEGTVLSEADRTVLALERRHWNVPGAKAQAVHDQLGWSLARYYQRLNAILDDPAALHAEPSFVWSLIRRREQARRLRSYRSAGGRHRPGGHDASLRR